MSKAKLVFVIHNHQPTGNFDEVFRSATDACYEPFVAALEANPHVKAALHYTGPLLEWLERNSPELLLRVRALAGRGQVEVVGGAWYEPMLCVLPDRDAIGQIRTMRAECVRLFGRAPAGMWLAERVWDPDLPRILAAAGVRYVLLDDTHFRCAGVQDEWVSGWYVTEKAGAAVAVLPIAKQLRYAIPFGAAAGTVETIALRRGEILTYGDDGEKFGVWPGTAEWVWGKGWLRDFFRILGERSDAVETIHPSEAIADRTAMRGRIYLPTASYQEMGEWSLPAAAGRRLIALRSRLERDGLWDDAAPFVRGGIWQNFLAKYPEANRMHKRMLRASRKVQAAVERDPLHPRAIGPDNARARLELYRGQCNCAYWHGLFGGLYLPHLRSAVQSHLIRAEAMVDPCPEPRVSREDWDLDGADEVIIESAALTVIVKPHISGALEAFDIRERAFDPLDTLARRPEVYHADVAEAAERARAGAALGGRPLPPREAVAEAVNGQPASIHDRVRKADARLPDLLRYDDLPKLCLLDRILPPDASFDAWDGGALRAVVEPTAFAYSVERSEAGPAPAVGMRAAVASPWGPLDVTKAISLDPADRALDVRWTIAPAGGGPAGPARFATGLTINLPGGSDPMRGYAFDEPQFAVADRDRALASRGALPGVRRFRMIDGRLQFEIAFAADPCADLWRRPVETVSQSEEGFEAVFQGSDILIAWPLDIPPGGRASFGLRIGVALR